MADNSIELTELSPHASSKAPRDPFASFKTERWLLFFILAATCLVYANSLSGEFVYDDIQQIVQNPQIRSWKNLLTAFSTSVWDFRNEITPGYQFIPYYRPLFTIYLTLGYHIFGLWPQGWHLASLFLHLATTALVFFLFRRLTKDLFVAASTALLFGLHPTHVESVSWISGVTDPLLAVFYVSSALAYLRYLDEKRLVWYFLSLALYSLAILAKEPAVTIPAILIALEYHKCEKTGDGKRLFLLAALKRILPYFVLGGAYLIARYEILGLIDWVNIEMARVPRWQIYGTLPAVIFTYLKNMVFPFYLSPAYPVRLISGFRSADFMLPLLIIGICFILTWLTYRKLGRDSIVAFFFFSMPLLPALNLKIFHPAYLVQDRYLYIPSIGFCFLLALIIRSLQKARIPQYSCALLTIAIALSWGASVTAQNLIWRDGESLWHRAEIMVPYNWNFPYNVAIAQIDRRDFESARQNLERAAKMAGLSREAAPIYNNLSLVFFNLGDTEKAIKLAQVTIELDPTLLEAYNNLGVYYASRKEYAEAKKLFEFVLKRNPRSTMARSNLADAQAVMGDHDEAIRNYRIILNQIPQDYDSRFKLAISLLALGRRQEAISELSALASSESIGPDERRWLERHIAALKAEEQKSKL
jgi:tetratricopeptide (TPR) repeat protein